MKSVLLTTVVLTFLVSMACAKPPPPCPSISGLTGVWVEERSVQALHETLGPQWSYGLVIEASKDGKKFRLYYGNATEGIGYHLLGLDRTAKAGAYAFRMGRMFSPYDPDRRSEPGRPFRVRVFLGFDDKGKVKHITLPDNCFGFSAPRDRFVRIPIGWLQYINRVVFAGKWKDESGDVFSFEESGKGHWPYRLSFTYKVTPSLGDNSVQICLFPKWGPPCDNYILGVCT